MSAPVSKLLTLRTFPTLGGGQSGYSNFFLYLEILGGGALKKTPCMYDQFYYGEISILAALNICILLS